MQYILVAFLLSLPLFTWAGGGSSPSCQSSQAALCQTQDGSSLVDVIRYNCEDDWGNWWQEHDLHLNLPGDLYSVRLYRTDDPFEISSKKSGEKFVLTSQSSGEEQRVDLEMSIKRGRGSITIVSESGQALLSAELICR